MTDVFTEGWSMDDYKQLHDLKVKANPFNLEVGFKILRGELVERQERQAVLARKAILDSYFEDPRLV